jgi:hypothetical protein
VKSAVCARGTTIISKAERLAAGANTMAWWSASTSRSPFSSSDSDSAHQTQRRDLIIWRAPPPISSATQCGTWGMAYSSTLRCEVRDPACRPWLCTTWM